MYDWFPCDSSARSQEAPTIVFIHGWLLSRRYWEPVISQLKAEFSCLSYDLRGFGDAPIESNRTDYSLQAYAQDLKVLLDRLSIGPVWLVGHSLGGSIAIWGAHNMGDRVLGVTCVNAGGGIYLKEEFEKFRNAGQQMLKVRPAWLAQAPLLDRVFAQMAACQNLGSRWGRQRLVDFIGANLEAARSSLLDSTTEAEVHRLPQIVAGLSQPLQFITGDRDKIMEPRYVRHLASFHSQFQSSQESVLEIPNCGHFAMLEHPDRVATALQKSLQQLSLVSSLQS